MSNSEPVDLTVSKSKSKLNLFRPYEDVETVRIELNVKNESPCQESPVNFSTPVNQSSTPKSSEQQITNPYLLSPNLYSHCQFLFPYQWYQRRLSRPLCGKYVRSGPAASRLTLLVLRQRILQRQQMKLFLHTLSMSKQPETTKTTVYPTNSSQFIVR